MLRSRAHRLWIAEHRCIVCTRGFAIHEGQPVSQAAHVRMGHGGMGLKPSDDRCLPLCPYHHRISHNGWGEAAFWRDVGLDPIELLEKFA